MMDVFAEAGIKFSVITPDRTEEVCQFMSEYFYPDEPIFRSVGIKRNNLMDSIYSEAIKEGSSVMATDSSGKIIGVRITEILDKNSWLKKSMERFFISSLPILAKLGKILKKTVFHKACTVCHALLTKLNYKMWPLFDELGCQKILSDVCVCTSREARVKGLGTELVKEGEAVGRSKGCEYSVNLVTGLYSGKIFRDKLKYTVRSEVFYAQFIDEDGNLYLNDTREHLSCFMCYKKISD